LWISKKKSGLKGINNPQFCGDNLPTKIVDYVDNSYFKRSSPIFTTFPAPIVINKSPFIHFSLKKSSISAKEGK